MLSSSSVSLGRIMQGRTPRYALYCEVSTVPVLLTLTTLPVFALLGDRVHQLLAEPLLSSAMRLAASPKYVSFAPTSGRLELTELDHPTSPSDSRKIFVVNPSESAVLPPELPLPFQYGILTCLIFCLTLSSIRLRNVGR